MTSDRIFNCLARHLEALVTANGGVFAASETVAQTLSMLVQGPGRWRCILQWQREDPAQRGENELKVLVVVQQAIGLSIKSGEDVTVKRGDDLALLPRANQVFAWLRAVTFDNPDIDKPPLSQGKTQWLADPSFPTRQISAEFAIKYGLEPVNLVHLTVE